jgi:hypothetical protein
MAKTKARPHDAPNEELRSGGVRKNVDLPDSGEVLDPRGPVPTTG